MPAVSRSHFPCSQPWPNTEQNREGIFIFFCFVALPLTPRKRNRNCYLCVRVLHAVLGHTHTVVGLSTFSGLWQKPVGMFTPNHWSRAVCMVQQLCQSYEKGKPSHPIRPLPPFSAASFSVSSVGCAPLRVGSTDTHTQA